MIRNASASTGMISRGFTIEDGSPLFPGQRLTS